MNIDFSKKYLLTAGILLATCSIQTKATCKSDSPINNIPNSYSQPVVSDCHSFFDDIDQASPCFPGELLCIDENGKKVYCGVFLAPPSVIGESIERPSINITKSQSCDVFSSSTK